VRTWCSGSETLGTVRFGEPPSVHATQAAMELVTYSVEIPPEIGRRRFDVVEVAPRPDTNGAPDGVLAFAGLKLLP
jgi:hypothetical protein